MTKGIRRALVVLGALVVFGVILTALVASDMPLTKEFVGTIAGGITGVVATVYAAQSQDEAKAAREGSERAEIEAKSARSEAGKTDRERKRDRKTAHKS